MVCTLNQEYLHTTGVNSGVEFLVSDVISGGSIYTTGLIICSDVSGVTYSLVSDVKRPIYGSSYSPIVGMYCRSTKSGSVSAPDDIVLISVSGSTNSMCGALFYPASTPVVSRPPIGRFLISRNCR